MRQLPSVRLPVEIIPECPSSCFKNRQGTNRTGAQSVAQSICNVPGLLMCTLIWTSAPSQVSITLSLTSRSSSSICSNSLYNFSTHYSLALSITFAPEIITNVLSPTSSNMAPATSKTATPKAATTGAGVKKAGRPSKADKRGNARNAMIKMQAYCKFCEV